MTLLIALLIFFLATLLLYNNRETQPNSKWLAFSMIILSIIQLAHYFAFAGISNTWMAIFFMHPMPLYFLLGPFIFFYVRGVLTDQIQLSRSDAWHFIPSIIALIGMMPYVIKPWSFKLLVAQEMIRDVHYMVIVDDLMLYPATVNIVLRLLTWFIYIGYSLYLVFHFKRNYPAQGRIPFKDARRTLHFLVAFLLILLAVASFYATLTVEYFLRFEEPTKEFISTPWVLLTNVAITIIPFTLILYPEVLYGIPLSRDSGRQFSKKKSPKETLTTAPNQKSEPETALTPADELAGKPQEFQDEFKLLSANILELLESQKPFLDPDFSLDDLSRELDVPKHHLYYCLNKILNTRFTRLRAEYRVRHAQKLIDGGESRRKTLEAIGLESGFSNRISFNNAFREITGKSPSDYLRDHNF